MIIERRKFLTGLGALIAAPAIVKASSLMQVRGVIQEAYAPVMSGTEILARYRWREERYFAMFDGTVWMFDNKEVWRANAGEEFSMDGYLTKQFAAICESSTA